MPLHVSPKNASYGVNPVDLATVALMECMMKGRNYDHCACGAWCMTRLMSDFTVLIMRSARPFYHGACGIMRISVMPKCLHNISKSPLNSVPLSTRSCAGIPKGAMMELHSHAAVCVAPWEGSKPIITNFVKSSTATMIV